MDIKWYDDQIEAFKEVKSVYEEFAKHLKCILERVASIHKTGAIVQVRAKAIPSFAEKIIRKRDQYTDPINQLTDLCGARVIAERRDQLNLFIDYIKTHFEIDEANSVDVRERLRATEFGYRSVHFIVSFKPGVFPDIPEILYKRHTTSDPEIMGQPRFKAEIQVRTLLQHAWGAFNHVFMYKANFKMPDSWQRDAARIAAGLEDADNDFVRLGNEMTAYQSHQGGNLTAEQIKKEIEILETVSVYDSENPDLAMQITQLAMDANDWDKAIETLMKFKDSQNPDIFYCLGYAMIKSGNNKQLEKGRQLLAIAIELDPDNQSAYCALGETWQNKDDKQAKYYYEKAFHKAPADPEVLINYLTHKICRDRTTDFIPLVQSSLIAAIGVCKKRIELCIHLPQAYFDIGYFELLQGRPYESLNNYAKAVSLCDTPHPIDKAYLILSRINHALSEESDPITTNIEIISRFLDVARITRRLPSDKGKIMIQEQLSSVAVAKKDNFKLPVIIVAGGCDPEFSEPINTYGKMLMPAFENFSGSIISGGTTAGIPGIIGDLLINDENALTKIGYLPHLIPPDINVHHNYDIYRSTGHDFSMAEPIQNWIDLLAAGISPDQVKLIGINGGKIAAAEYRMAVALGARVGILRDSGRAASDLFKDPEWQNIRNLAMLPADILTLTEFIHFDEPSAFNEEAREKMAMKAHESYREEQKSRFYKNEPSMAKWQELKEDLKDSNRFQVDHMVRKLQAIGLTVRKSVPPESIPDYSFTNEQIETMAEMEHGRWNVERLLNGWTYANERDTEKKANPFLVSWSDLPESVKEWDRQAVQKIPALLKEIGYEIVEASIND